MLTMNTVLFSLIRASVDNGFSFDFKNLSLTQDDYICLLKIGKKHDISHLVAYGLKKLNLLPQDTQLSKKIQQEYLVAAFRSEQMEQTLKVTTEIFEKNNIPYILLKGSVLRLLYPEKWMRTSGDIDILIQKENMEKAIALFVKNGYAIDKKSTYDVALLYEGGFKIELHFDIMGYGVKSQSYEVIPNVWKYTIKKQGNEYALTDEMFYFYHISHMAKHFVSGGCGIKPFVDLWLIDKSKVFNVEAPNLLLKQAGLDNFNKNAKALCEVWFLEKEHSPLTQNLEDFVLTGGVYGNLENRVAIAQAQKGNKTKYFISRLFLPYDSLKNVFPVLNKHKWLFPFMQVARWFKIIFTGRARRSVKEISINSNRTDEQITQTQKLLKDIGL